MQSVMSWDLRVKDSENDTTVHCMFTNEDVALVVVTVMCHRASVVTFMCCACCVVFNPHPVLQVGWVHRQLTA